MVLTMWILLPTAARLTQENHPGQGRFFSGLDDAVAREQATNQEAADPDQRGKTSHPRRSRQEVKSSFNVITLNHRKPKL